MLDETKLDKPSRLIEMNEDVLWSQTKVFTQLTEILEFDMDKSEKMFYVN